MAISSSCASLLHVNNVSNRFQPLGFHQLPLHPAIAISDHKYGSSFLRDPSSQCIQTFQRARSSKGSKMDFIVRATPDPEVANFFSFWPPDNPWIAGIAGFAMIIPFLAQKIIAFSKEVDFAAETVEKIADAVEKVAEEVDKAAEEMAEALPEGGLKQVVHFVEGIAEETAKDAQKVEEMMDKIEELDEKVEAYFNNQAKGTAQVSKEQSGS